MQDMSAFLLKITLLFLLRSMEAVSWIFDANSTSFFVISDVANSIHGFVIFALFVWCRTRTTDSILTKHRSRNKIGSSMILGRLNDSKSDDSMVKKLKEKSSIK